MIKTNTSNTIENPETPSSNFSHELKTLWDEISKINNLDKWYIQNNRKEK